MALLTTGKLPLERTFISLSRIDKKKRRINDEAVLEEAIRCGMVPSKTLEQFNSKRHPSHKVVFDNLDMKLLRNFSGIDYQNTDLHMWNMMAVQNRIYITVWMG